MRAILTYHSIDTSGSPISVDEQVFRGHVRFLASGRVRVVPLADIGAMPPEDDVVAVSFDDGFSNLAELAWPLLRDHGLPTTVFVVSGRVGTTNDWDATPDSSVPPLPLLDWEGLARLADDGMTLGAHSRSHPHLERLPDAQRRDEIEGSAADIEARTGRRPRSFCYPYGTYDDGTVAEVARAYDQGCTTELRLLADGDEPHRLPRLDAYYYRRPGRLEAWGSPAFHRHLAARRLLRSAGQRLRSGA